MFIETLIIEVSIYLSWTLRNAGATLSRLHIDAEFFEETKVNTAVQTSK